MRRFLDDNALAFESVHVYGTPQRLAVLVKGLIEGTESKQIERKGPAIASAFGGDGQPTPQGEGFLKAIGQSSVSLVDIRKGKVKALKIGTIKEVEYLFANWKKKVDRLLIFLRKSSPR